MFEVDARAWRNTPIGLVGVTQETPSGDGGNFFERSGIGLIGNDPEEQEDGGQGMSLGAKAGRAQKVIDLGR